MRDWSGFVLWLGMGALSLMVIVLIAYRAGLRWNLTDSVPRGIYWRTHRMFTHGDLIAFCLPPQWATFGQERGYIPQMPQWARECPSGEQALLKPVAAGSKDVVELMPEIVSINGIPMPDSATQPRDTEGRDLPHFPWGQYGLRTGEVWVMSTHHPHSWDSRYFGPIREESVIATAQPLWVWP